MGSLRTCLQPPIYDSRLLRDALPLLPPRRVVTRRRLQDETRLAAIQEVQHISLELRMLGANRCGYPSSHGQRLGVRASYSFGGIARIRCCWGTPAFRSPPGVEFTMHGDGAPHQHPRLHTTVVYVQVQMPQ